MASTSAVVLLDVTHSFLEARLREIRIDPEQTIAALKKRLMSHVGTEPQYQHLSLLDSDGDVVADLADDEATLSVSKPLSGYTIHVTDLDPSSLAAGGGLEDVAQVEKVTLSDQAAEKRKAEFAAFKAAKGGGKPKPQAVEEEHMAAEAAAFEVGAACGVGGRAATVRYVGKIPEIAPGYWLGVEYGDESGKNDGSFKGSRYFECAAARGSFLRPDKATLTES